ncbi:hypothetical protein HDU97_006338, partial [Phlyctochytrium planicorne]
MTATFLTSYLNHFSVPQAIVPSFATSSIDSVVLGARNQAMRTQSGAVSVLTPSEDSVFASSVAVPSMRTIPHHVVNHADYHAHNYKTHHSNGPVRPNYLKPAFPPTAYDPRRASAQNYAVSSQNFVGPSHYSQPTSKLVAAPMRTTFPPQLATDYSLFESFEDTFDSSEPEEYGKEIISFMHTMEDITMPSPSYMDRQGDLTWKLRKTLIVWLVDIHGEYDLRPETLYLAINFVDRACSQRPIERVQYQLLGITALWVAAKYEENHGKVPTLKNLIYICCNTYTEKDYLAMEQCLLNDLSFNLGHPTCEAFLKAYSRLISLSPETRAMARYIMEMTLVHRRFLVYKPSVVAKACLMAAEAIQGKRMSLHDPTVTKCFGDVLDVFRSPPKQLESKYRSLKFLNASQNLRNWQEFNPHVMNSNEYMSLVYDYSPLHDGVGYHEFPSGLLTPPKENEHMIDDILRFCVEEVALEGEGGCTVDRLWEILRSRNADLHQLSQQSTSNQQMEDANGPSSAATLQVGSVWTSTCSSHELLDGLLEKSKANMTGIPIPISDAFELDDSMKEFIWPWIARHKDLIFFVETGHVASDKGVRTNLAPSLLQMPYLDMFNSYGKTLRIAANEQQIRCSLLGAADANTKLSQILYDALVLITRYRENGLSQVEIGKVLNVEPSVKFPIVQKSLHTNLCVHRKFAIKSPLYLDYLRASSADHQTDGDVIDRIHAILDRPAHHEIQGAGVVYHPELIKQRISVLLSGAKNQIMLVQDLKDALLRPNHTHYERRWFNGKISILANAGYIEKVNVPRAEGSFDRCVKLIKPFVAAVVKPSQTVSETRKPKQISDDHNAHANLGFGGILADLPLDFQVFRLIQRSGTRGITVNELQRCLNNIGRVMEKILKRLLTPAEGGVAPIACEFEFFGRERRYRYFTTESYQNVVSKRSGIDVGQDAERDEMSLDLPGKKATESPEIRGGRKLRKRKEPLSGSYADGDPDEQNKSQKRSKLNSDDESTFQGTPRQSDASDQEIEDIVCSKCRTDDNEEKLVLCGDKSCKNGMHIYCMQPPLDKVPEGSWHQRQFERLRERQAVKEEHQVALFWSTAFLTVAAKKMSTSMNMELRKTNILKLLEIHKIIEVGNPFLRKYESFQLSESGYQTPHMMDKKTMMRTAKSMEADGLLKMLTVTAPSLSNSTFTKTFMMHKSLDANHDDVKAFIASIQDRAYLPPTKPRGRMPTTNRLITVERLSDLQKEIAEESSPSVQMASDTHDSTFLDADESASSSPIPERAIASAPRTPVPAPSVLSVLAKRVKLTHRDVNPTTPIYASRRFGYVTAGMYRQKIFHHWLYEICTEGRGAEYAETVPSRYAGRHNDDYVFGVWNLYNDMTLDIYLKVVGNNKLTEDFLEFVKSEENLQITLANLPRGVKKVINQPKMKETLFVMLTALELLKLVTPRTVAEIDDVQSGIGWDMPDETRQIAVKSYIFNKVVPLYDYRKPHLPLIRNYVFDSEMAVKYFWIELEHICTQAPQNKLARTDKNLDTAKFYLRFGESDQRMPKFISYMQTFRNWQYSYPFTTAERGALEEHVNREDGTTPLIFQNGVREVAEKTGISMEKVKYYFTRVEQNYHYKIMKLQLRSQRAKMKRRAKEITANAVRLARKPDQSEEQRSNLRSRVRKILEASTSKARTDEDEEVELESELTVVEAVQNDQQSTADHSRQQQPSQPTTATKIIKRTRQKRHWAPEADEFLLLAHIILEAYCTKKKLRMSWTPVSNYLQRNNDLCRRRFDTLSRIPTYAARLRRLQEQWPPALAEGLGSGTLSDFDGPSLLQIDIEKYVSYFIKWTTEENQKDDAVEPIVIELPVTVADLNMKYDTILANERRLDIDFWIEDLPSTRARMAVALLQPLFALQDAEYVLDILMSEEFSMDDILDSVFVAASKSSYTPNEGLRAMHRFSEEVRTRGANLLQRKGGSFAKSKRTPKDRPLPGRGIILSERFYHVYNGKFPVSFIPQAQQTQSTFNTGNFALPESFLNGGTVMAILDNVIRSKVSIEPLDSFYQAGPIDESEDPGVRNCLSVTLKANPSDSEQNRSVSGDQKKSGKASSRTSVIAESSQSSKYASLILQAIKSSGSKGVTLVDLRTNPSLRNLSDISILNTLRGLLSKTTASWDASNPVIKVGLAVPRYVCLDEAASWMMTCDNDRNVFGNLIGSTQNEGSKTLLFPARIWYNLRGEFLEDVYNKCVDSIIGHIQLKPGISEVSFVVRFYIFFCSLPRLCDNNSFFVLFIKGALFNHVQIMVNKVELTDILEDLMDRGALRRSCYLKKKPASNILQYISARRANQGAGIPSGGVLGGPVSNRFGSVEVEE